MNEHLKARAWLKHFMNDPRIKNKKESLKFFKVKNLCCFKFFEKEISFVL